MTEPGTDVVFNPTKKLLDEGGLSLLFSVRQIRSVDIALIAKAAGYDSLYMDLEHGELTISEAGQICVTALAAGITPIVRVPENSFITAAKVLDLGAMGIIAPHISGPEDAERMVDACMYPPVGHRSNTSTLPHQWLSSKPFLDVQKQINEETMVFAMIESAEGLENVDGIAAVDGVSCLLVGTSDLTHALGIPGQFTSDTVMKALERICAAAKKHGKHVSLGGGIKGSDPGLLKSLIDMGINQISVGNDSGLLTGAMRQRVADIRAHTG